MSFAHIRYEHDKMVTGKGKPKYRTKMYLSVIISNVNNARTVLALIFAVKCQRITTCFVCSLFNISVNWRLFFSVEIWSSRKECLLPVTNFMSAWRDAGQPREVSIRSTVAPPKLEPTTTRTQANLFVVKLVHPWYSPMFLTPFEVLEDAYRSLSGNSLHPGELAYRHN
jgi:hypothetical protein